MEGLPDSVELVHAVVGRLEPLLIRGSDGADEAVHLRARTLAIAPDDRVSVLLVEPLRLQPHVVRAVIRARPCSRRVLRFDCGSNGLLIGRNGFWIRSPAAASAGGENESHTQPEDA